MLASLNHPNIAAIYGLEDSGEAKALVLELVEGETLAERVRRGPLPVEEALEVGEQIAKALEAAHEKGIIHRDLKPGNVKLTPEGKVKVLDFGLAKLAETEPAAAPTSALEDSPTALADNTRPGTILGTAAYMSPEQAKGKPVDKRTDIWSFGCVLYECLTGKKVFGGETATDSIGAVLHKEPDWTALPKELPPTIQLLLRKCLAKDRKRRLHDIADARVDLEQALGEPGSSTLVMAGAAVESAGRRERSRGWLTALPWVLTAAAVAFALLALRSSRSNTGSSAKPTLQTYTLNLHPDAPLATLGGLGSTVVISPDCSKVVYLGRKDGAIGLYWKRINDPEFTLIPDSVKTLGSPVFAPQSDRLAFFNALGDLYVFSFQGGKPRKIGQVGTPIIGAQWNPDNRILLATTEGIYVVEAKEGSTPVMILKVDKDKGERFLGHPRFMPGAKGAIFTVAHTNQVVSLEALDLTTQARKKLDLTGSLNPLYYPATGHLLYGRDDVLWARAFDPLKLEFTGPEVSLLKDLGRDWAVASHQFSLADNGTLIYGRGHQLDPRYQLVWVRDRADPEVVPLAAGDYRAPRLAPDGKSAILTRGSSSAGKSLRVGLADGQAVELASGDSGTRTSAFAYDGTNVFFNREVGGELTVLRARADATATPEEIYRAKEDNIRAHAISPDGRFLALVRGYPGDILLKDLKSADEARPFANTPANEAGPRFSPDGRWLAYTADIGDRFEAYVRRISEGGLPIQISKNGGSHPVWSRDGSKLYYLANKEIMVREVKSFEPLELDAPVVFATGRFRSSGLDPGPNYEAFTDAEGDRLLMLKSVEDEPEPSGATQVTVKVHFDEFIRQQAAQGKGRVER